MRHKFDFILKLDSNKLKSALILWAIELHITLKLNKFCNWIQLVWNFISGEFYDVS